MTAAPIPHDVDVPTGNRAVFDTQPDGLSDEQKNVPEARESKEEGTQLASSLAETTRTTVSLATVSVSLADEESTLAGVLKSQLSSTPKPSATASLHEVKGVPSKNAAIRNTEGHLMALDPPVSKFREENGSQDLEQAPEALSAALPSTLEKQRASPAVQPSVSQETLQTAVSSSLSSHSHTSGSCSALSEISSQDETYLDSNAAMRTAASAFPAVKAEHTLRGARNRPPNPVASRPLVPPAKKVSFPGRPMLKVRPRSSIPSDLSQQEYAGQCIAAAESSRLNPYALHEEEHSMLRHCISHAQVTTYLNIRNGILRLWLRKPSVAITRLEALGCARDKRWFNAANICFDWLVRRGYINFGCVEIKEPSRGKGVKASLSTANFPAVSSPHNAKKTIAIIGAGMAGLGCARQLDNLFRQFRDRFTELGIEVPDIVVLEGRDRIGGRVYSRQFQIQTRHRHPGFNQSRCTAEMGGMIVTGFDRGNPLNILIRGQLGLGYHALITATRLYDINGKPVDDTRDGLVENLFNECLERASEYKFKPSLPLVVEGNHDLMDNGRDNTSEGHPTIASIEDSKVVKAPTAANTVGSAAAFEQTATTDGMYGTGGSQQPDLVPVSSDRLTGRAHVEPGTIATLNAAHKLKSMGWPLRPGVPESRDLNLDPASEAPGATLGSVVEDAIGQYGELVDLNSQDFRLLNWHVANLEYSNAINLNGLSLKYWDIDNGNEWEGRHSMVIGGYQSVPRGLMLCPTPLDVRSQMEVKKITYSESAGSARAGSVEKDEPNESPVVIEFEDGAKFEADYVVNTIPLGVLKHGNIEFEPPLPSWKLGSIARLGYGVLNKIILTYRQPFWDTDRDIFGVLREPTNRFSLDQKQYSKRRGRMFQWFNVSRTTGIPCLLALMAGDAAFDTEKANNDELVAEATSVLRSIFGASNVPEPIEAVVTRWASDKFSRGSYSSSGPDMDIDDYDSMARPVGKHLHFAGEHTIGTYPATVHGAYLSGLRAASDIFEELVGPIDIPTPLVPLKETLSPALKRKHTVDEDDGKVGDESSGSMSAGAVGGSNYREAKTGTQKRMEARSLRIEQYINSQIGDRPSQPPKMGESAYSLFIKGTYEKARKQCEEGRRPGKGRSTPNEVRVLTSKMWRSVSAEERRPFADEAATQKQLYETALTDYNESVAEWDRQAAVLRAMYEIEHPQSNERDVERTPQTLSPSVSDLVAGTPEHASPNSGRRLRRTTSYQATNGSDVDMGL